MKVLFACGGTAGHINPAIAVADTLRRQNPDTEILFVGNPNRMEAKLVPLAGYQFEPLVVEGFYRNFKPQSIAHNFKSVWYLLTAGSRVKGILQRFQPDVVFGTGGYVSGPVLRTAAKLGYATATHESNAYPGITTKLLARYVDTIMLAVEDAELFLPQGKNYLVTGNPVRPEILEASRAQARQKLGVGQRVCLLSYGGSNGASRINEVMAEVIAQLQPKQRTHHIHATGHFDIEEFPERLMHLGVDLEDPHLDVREYIDNMAECLAAADLVICRAGAMALSELEAVGKASVLIPSPNVSENHQYHNAMVLARRNAALVIEEKNLTAAGLLKLIQELLDDPDELDNIATNAQHLGISDGAQRICEELYHLYCMKSKRSK